MSARIIDGKDLQQPIIERTVALMRSRGIVPALALITVDHPDPDARLQTGPAFDRHVGMLGGMGITVRPHRFPEGTSQEEILKLVEELNADDSCDGIFMLVPPPPQIDLRQVINAIDPAKELEALHPVHAARLLPTSLGEPTRRLIVAATLRTVFDEVGLDFTDKRVVIVVDRENLRHNLITQLVAKLGSGLIWPTDTTLTVVHTEHPELDRFCREADVLLLAVPGHPGLVQGSWVKPGAHVYDFGATVIGRRPHPQDPERMLPVMAGGARNEEVAQVADVLCPAPRGFGPVMLALLAENLVQAAVQRRESLR
jgi:methylenetetrahydrofolate dehydrogenase (NADP+)/methenyltetrahydrofolate cyclohydrolase